MSYLLSIVVPTRNRQKYAIQSVLQIYHVTDERVQIVVQDNSDEEGLEEMLASEQLGNRVKYTFIRERITGVANYAGGIEQSDGEYVCCIGDDDGVLRRIVDVTQWAKEHNVPAVKPGVQASYIWPETTAEFPTGCLNLEYTDSSFFYVNPKRELIPFLESGCIDLPTALLVKAYHGIVRKDMFENIFQKTGKYCGGLSPDIYLSVSLSLCSESLLCMNLPLTIFGACKQSTTGDSINRINVGKLEQAPHFIGQPYTWSDKVPRYYCGTNIWADSAMHALEEMGAVEYQKYYSVEKLTCDCLLNHPAYKKEIMENFRRNQCSDKKLRAELMYSYPRFVLKKIKVFLRGIKIVAKVYRALRSRRQEKINDHVFMIQEVPDIIKAEDIVSSTLDHTVDMFLANVKEDIGGVDHER